MERLEIVDLFAYADKLYRNIKLILDRNDNAALCCTVQFSENDTAYICCFLEKSCLIYSILTGSCVQNEKCFNTASLSLCGDDTIYLMDQVSDSNNSEDKWVDNLNLKDALRKLGDREKEIVMLRYYIGKTQMEVSEEIGISQAQVSRLEKNAIKFIKKAF